MSIVKIYTTSTCPYCEMEKEYLDEKGVKYENIEVDHNVKAAQEMLEKSGQMGVPFTVIKKEDDHEETILGFDKEKLDQVLGLN
jgi:glutaredoxin-like YruB-family protein